MFIFKRTLRGRSLCFVLEMLNNVTPSDTYSVQIPSGGVTWKLLNLEKHDSTINLNDDEIEDLNTPFNRKENSEIPISVVHRIFLKAIDVKKEPSTYYEASEDKLWRLAMDNELQSLNTTRLGQLKNYQKKNEHLGANGCTKLSIIPMELLKVFECLRAPHAQDFLLAIPIDGLGQHPSPVEYRTILKYRLMISLFSVDGICPVCRKASLDSFGEHAVHCKELS
nr:auxilin-like protein [Tanacetum cinerariifolium]GEY69162.1 auxilin-like protein [Tanacetum cinerariifolium]